MVKISVYGRQRTELLSNVRTVWVPHFVVASFTLQAYLGDTRFANVWMLAAALQLGASGYVMYYLRPTVFPIFFASAQLMETKMEATASSFWSE